MIDFLYSIHFLFVERLNATLATALRSLAENHKSEWDLFIPSAIWAYNTRFYSTPGSFSYSLLFGREMTSLDNWTEVPLVLKSYREKSGRFVK